MDAELIAEFAIKRHAFDAAEEALKKAEIEYREVEEIVWDKMFEAGVSNMKVDGLGTCTRTIKGPYTSIDTDDPDAQDTLRKWCTAMGYDRVFRYQPVMTMLNPIVREMREKGEILPPGIKITEHRRVAVLKSK